MLGICRAVLLLVLMGGGAALAQCPTANFSVAASACQNERFVPVNLSTGSSAYEWDFCSGELALAPSATAIFSNVFLQRSRSFRVVKFNLTWVGFAIDVLNNKFLRFDFGNSLTNTPMMTNLNNPGSLLSGAFDFQLYNENGNWYALVANSGGNNLLRFDFGSDLLSTPTAISLGSFSLLDNPDGIFIVKDSNEINVFIANGGPSPEIIQFNYGSSLNNTPSTTSIPISGGSGLRGISFIKECDRWFGLVSSYNNNKIFYLDFVTGLNQPPATGDIGISPAGFPASLALQYEGGVFYAFIQSALGPLYRINFGTSIIDRAGTGQNLTSLGASTDNFALSWINDGTYYYGFSIDNSSNTLLRITMPSVCSASPSIDATANPVVAFSSSGNYNITLRSIDNAGNVSAIAKSITINALPSPDIDFISVNNCVGNNVTFSESNISGNITSRAWDFGDNQSSTSLNPSHVYSSAGTYQAGLTVTASNACTNFVFKIVSVYNSPIADFNIPAAPLICTNQSYLFSNTTIFDPASNPTWEWRLNGSLVSTQKDFATAFNSATPQDIRLRAIIPGCQNEQIKSIASVTTGPSISFAAADNCQSTSIAFINNSSGADAGFVWDFGDATTSTQINPSHSYSLPGTLQVKLTGSNSAGCQNFTIQPLKIYSRPIPNFSVGLPPFACSNTATPFQNNTPTLTDSNISTWSWQFGDPAAGISSQQNPSYVYSSGANYNVALTALTDKGCSGTFTKSISIASSPVADFTVGPSCLNLGTKFTDLSSGSVQTRAWQIASATFGIPSPTYTFTSPGDFLATLTVTGANLCSTFKTKTVSVPVPPALDFSGSNLCSGKSTRFTDITLSPQDVIVGWNWNFAGNSTTGNPVENIFTTAGLQNIKMTTTHSSGCKYTLSKNVLINTSPVADFIATPDRGSAPLIVQFTNTSQLASNYVWKFYDRVLATTTQTSPSHTFISLGNYSTELTATSAQGCVDVKVVPIIVLVPTVDLALTDFALTSDPTTGKLKGVITILNKSNIPLVSAEIGLILADKAVVNETFMINLNPGQSVSKTLSFTISPNQFEFNFLCAQINSEKDVDQSNNKRCINLEKVDYFFSPYPNPTTGLLHVDWISIVPEIAHLIIYDAMGRKNYEWETLSAVGLNQSKLDVTFLSSGVYFLSIETSGVKKTSRFFRQ